MRVHDGADVGSTPVDESMKAVGRTGHALARRDAQLEVTLIWFSGRASSMASARQAMATLAGRSRCVGRKTAAAAAAEAP